ncbi:glycosyltransferase family 4 protein [Microbulbifer sp. ALW1]|uniref:glycosyltransferase family 4 protein n=1 Tax=Microbulbifer sp. (strain ALW1) TaxID=1516059 RepID=UPI0013578259|nr:glycosyltransferase family 4 protein [Microbulbifer sp. ALW1]
MKVIVLAKSIPPRSGGIERYSYELAKSYKAEGCQVTLITSGIKRSVSEDPNVGTVVSVGYGNQVYIFLKLILVCLKNRLHISRADIIHATSWRLMLPTFFLKRHKEKRIVTIHGNEILKKNRLIRILMTRSMSMSDVVVAVSQYTASAFENLSLSCQPYPNVIVSYNGVSLSAESSLAKRLSEKSTVKFFTVCRLEKRKNLEMAIQALADLKASGVLTTSGFLYKIAGSGPELDSLKAYVKKVGLDREVEILGRVSDEDLHRLYATSDIFLHPQLESTKDGDVEGFGLVVADAMAMGLVTFAGGNGGTKELIIHGETGFLVDPDNVSSLAGCIESLLAKKYSYEKISKAAIEYAKSNFKWKRHVSKIIEAIH